jgi:flagellar biosynthesis/type III secretory pathway M-ring protein FliF/YscJ
METGWWIAIVVVIALVAVVVANRVFRNERSQQAQVRRMADLQQDGTRSAGEQSSQREERRLAGMSAEDREWEQASLQRHQERESRTHAPEAEESLG